LVTHDLSFKLVIGDALWFCLSHLELLCADVVLTKDPSFPLHPNARAGC
jgi:hypothetical protein